jgi:hypothetical protein
MMHPRQLATLLFAVSAICCGQLRAQTTSTSPSAPKLTPAVPWNFNLSVSGYIVPQGQSYASPTLTADHGTLHLEARYNYEAQRTASLWFGYNYSVGKKVTFDVTPMIGGAFGDVNGIAPGVEFTIAYKKLQLYSANEYIFDTNSKAGNFFYTWTQLTYSPVPWFEFGYVTQRTRAYQTPLGIQRGPMIEFTHKKMTFSTQAFNIGEASPTYVLSLGYTF